MIFFAKKIVEKFGVFDNYAKNLNITLLFKKNGNFLPKFGENRRKL
jgi:hypothetical protein